MAKISVIGAGIGGMSAAARLAKNGHEVTIFENSERSGGKCRTEWFGDFAFDTGPSLLTLPAVYRDLFLKTGKRLEHILELVPVDPAFKYNFTDGKSITFPNLSNPKTYQEISRVLGDKSGQDWKKIIDRAERMWELSREQFVESELDSIWPLLKNKNLFRQIKEIAPFTSLRQLSNKMDLDPHLKMIIDRYATYTGSDPRRAPAVLLTIAFVESAFGAWHIKGGIGQLSNALQTRCQDLGVKFEFNSRVTEITVDHDRLAHHNVFFPQNYDNEFEDVFNRKIPVDDPTIYICAPKDDSMVKSVNKESWFVLVNAPRHEPDSGWDWQQNGDIYAKKIVNKLDGLGMNVSPRLEFLKYRTPADLENYAMAPGGSIYGTSSNSAASAFLRARNRSKTKGLFCVGGSAHPGGGLPLVGISAEIVANCIGKA